MSMKGWRSICRRMLCMYVRELCRSDSVDSLKYRVNMMLVI